MSNRNTDMKFPKNGNSYAVAGSKCQTNGIVDYGVIGEKGENGPNLTLDEIDHITTKFAVTNLKIKMDNRPFKWILKKYIMPDGTINWDELGFCSGINPDRKGAFVISAQLMYDYLTSSNALMTICGVNLDTIMVPLIRKVIEDSECTLEAPDKFYDYCVNFIRANAPHYENIRNKIKGESVDFEAQITFDLAKNVLEILKNGLE